MHGGGFVVLRFSRYELPAGRDHETCKTQCFARVGSPRHSKKQFFCNASVELTREALKDNMTTPSNPIVDFLRETNGLTPRKNPWAKGRKRNTLTPRETSNTLQFFGDKMAKPVTRFWDRIFMILEAAVFAVAGLLQRKRSPWLIGNHAPVAYEVDGECELISGALPEELHGAYMRNGYNAALRPQLDYHPFEADGMIHCVRLRADNVQYGNRFIRTRRFEVETKYGRPMFIRISDLKGIRGLIIFALRWIQQKMGIIPIDSTSRGYGTANTSLMFHGDKLLALQEGDAPFEVRALCSGVVETIGTVDHLAEGLPGVSAHPKVDRNTGSLYTFGYQVVQKPFVTMGIYNADESLERSIPLMSVNKPTLMHDFGMTENFLVILETALEFDLKQMVMKNGPPFMFNEKASTRFGILDKQAADENNILWIEIPEPCWMSHVVNAAEVDGCILVDAIYYSNMDLDTMNGAQVRYEWNISSWKLNMNTGFGERRAISPKGLRPEFPVINSAYASHGSYRWSWVLLLNESTSSPWFSSIAKIDVQAGRQDRERGIVATIEFGYETYGNEFVFVPRYPDAEFCKSEDDGYIMGYINDEADGNHTGYFVVYDAMTMDPTPVCKYRIPQRVPYGLHGIFINEQQFQKQAKT